MRIQRERLEHHRRIARAHRHMVQVAPADQDAAAVWPLDAGDDAQQRRLARAARAEDREELPRVDVQRDAAQSLHRAESLVDVVDRQFHVLVVPPSPAPVSRRMSGRRRGRGRARPAGIATRAGSPRRRRGARYS
jgi:hypothetical protein